MADDADDGGGQGQPDGALGDRVGKLEAGQESIAGKVDQILGMLDGGKGADGGGGHTGEDTGGHVGLEIRRQLDERDARRRQEDDSRSVSDRVGALEAALSETKPGPVPRRVHKVMGWAE